MKNAKLPPIHPGEVLLEEFLKPLAISQYRLAKGISVPPRRVNEIVLHKRSVSADTALRLSRFFGTSAEFWLNLQSQYDLDVEGDRLGGRLEAEVVKFAPRSAHAKEKPHLKTTRAASRVSAMRKSK
jgi:addiction module HigA family antidote